MMHISQFGVPVCQSSGFLTKSVAFCAYHKTDEPRYIAEASNQVVWRDGIGRSFFSRNGWGFDANKASSTSNLDDPKKQSVRICDDCGLTSQQWTKCTIRFTFYIKR